VQKVVSENVFRKVTSETCFPKYKIDFRNFFFENMFWKMFSLNQIYIPNNIFLKAKFDFWKTFSGSYFSLAQSILNFAF